MCSESFMWSEYSYSFYSCYYFIKYHTLKKKKKGIKLQVIAGWVEMCNEWMSFAINVVFGRNF